MLTTDTRILDLALDRAHLFQDLPDGVPSAFGSDDDAGVEDYSHAGGFHGLRLLRMVSTSSAKSASSTGALPVFSSCALARAMHSEMLRRTGSAAWSTATGRASFSITTSAPARTWARSVATLVVAASFSEMWITCLAMTRLYTATPPLLPRLPLRERPTAPLFAGRGC